MTGRADDARGGAPLRVSEVIEPELRLLHVAEASSAFEDLPEANDATEAERMRRLVDFAHTNPTSALCLSGGGIRSATFCLGALQELARRELLGDFHYLSTV